MNRITLILATLMLAACSSGGSGNPGPPPVVDIPLDGIYRASPPLVSANGLTFDYADPIPGAWQQLGSVGRVYTTTTTGNAVSGTATMYRAGGVVENSALTGDISPTGVLTLNFPDGAQNVNVQSQRLAEAAIELAGRAWCINEFDNVTVHSCGEFDVLNNLTFATPSHGSQNQVNVTIGEQVDANVYEVSIAWEVCGTMSGVVGFSESEDGTTYEMAVNVVNGSCGYQWWQLTTVR